MSGLGMSLPPPEPEGRAIPFGTPAPLDALEEFIARYVVLTPDQRIAVTLWTLHTQAIDAAETTPYLWFRSATKRAGKTRALEVVELVVCRPLMAANVSAAALFRSLGSDAPPTVLMDEVDAIFGPKANGDEDLRALLNAGYRRGAHVLRCVGDGSRQTVVEFPVFGAKALSGIGRLPDTIADRCLPIRMKRRARGERIERLRRREARAEADALRELCAAWTLENLDALAIARPDLPTELDDRAQDAYEPLVAIADLAGGEWPHRARKALVALRAQGDEEEATAAERILADCRAVFEERNVDRLATADLLEALRADEEAPWADWGGKGLTAHGLGRMLGEYGIRSRTIRLPGGDTPKGYMRASFEDAWTRYTPVSANQNATPPQASNHAGLTRGVLESAETETPRLNAFTDAGCGGVADRKPETGESGERIDLGTASLDKIREHFGSEPSEPEDDLAALVLQDAPAPLAALGDEGFPSLLADALQNGHVTQAEAEERLALHRRVEANGRKGQP
jgi:hypothetical protein